MSLQIVKFLCLTKVIGLSQVQLSKSAGVKVSLSCNDTTVDYNGNSLIPMYRWTCIIGLIVYIGLYPAV